MHTYICETTIELPTRVQCSVWKKTCGWKGNVQSRRSGAHYEKEENLREKLYSQLDGELFIVSAVKSTTPVTYKLTDLKGEEIRGSFYKQELQKAKQDTFRIEKVLKKRTRNGTKELYVKWKGYSNDFNTWIPDSDLR